MNVFVGNVSYISAFKLPFMKIIVSKQIRKKPLKSKKPKKYKINFHVMIKVTQKIRPSSKVF